MLRLSNEAIPAISAIVAARAAARGQASLTGLRFFALAIAAVGIHVGAQAATVLDLPSRPGITQQVSLEAVDAPRAVVLLFAGGEGGVRFDAEGAPTTLRGNFLLRARALFHPFRIATVVMGLPTDHTAAPYLTDEFRASPEHATDVGAVIAEMRRHWQVPVWLVATSRGTLSGAAVALNLGAPQAGPDGVVLTSTMTSITDFAIDHFAQPVLLVQHRNDQCRATHVHDLPKIKDKLKAPRSGVLMVGGGVSRGQWCEAFAYHGFNGVEDEVVADIAHWIVGE